MPFSPIFAQKIFNLSKREKKNAITDVKAAISKWKSIAKKTGLTDNRINEIWKILSSNSL